MTSLALSLLLLLCLQGDADQKKDCIVMLSVKRNTLWMAYEMADLTINCTVVHCGEKLEVIWCKLDSIDCIHVPKTEHIEIQRKSNSQTHIYFLRFIKISMNDTGLYRCKILGSFSSSVSHSINVSVIALHPSGPGHGRSTPLHWLYIYISAGVLVLVAMVAVTFCMLRWKGSKRPTAGEGTNGEARRDLQSSAPLNKKEPPQTPLRAAPRPALPDRPRSIRSPHAQRPPSVRSRCVYDNAPAPSRTRPAPAREAPPPGSSGGSTRPVAAGNNGVHGDKREEAENPITYASLNHGVARNERSLGTYVPVEELTEYAAIRVP